MRVFGGVDVGDCGFMVKGWVMPIMLVSADR